MTLLKPFTETMTEIGNTFGFKNIELYELEKFYKLELMMSDEPSDKIIKERAHYYSYETVLMNPQLCSNSQNSISNFYNSSKITKISDF